MMQNEKMLSRTGWWQIGVRLSLVSVLSVTLALGSILATPSPVQAATIYVDDDNCPGPGSGTQPDPYCRIQDAINAAGSSDTIKVAQGTYNENLTMNNAITLLGGYAPPDWTTQGPASSTTINGSSGSDSVIYVNDDDGGGTGITVFDEIIDVTGDLPVAPTVSIEFTVPRTRRIAPMSRGRANSR